MNTMIITDVTALVDDWNKAQSALSDRDQETLGSIALQRKTRAQIAKKCGVSNERARQIADRALSRFQEALLSQDQSPVLDAIHRMAHLVDTAGIKSAFSLGQDQFDQSKKVATQLVNTNAVPPQHTDWALAIIRLIPRPSPPRPSLKHLPSQVRTVVGQHHLGATPEHVVHHLDSWHTTFAAWPNFDIALHIQAVTGITPDPETGRYHPVNHWPITAMTPAYQLRHHIALSLQEADSCLTVPEITARANSIAQREGHTAHYRPRRIAAVLGSSDQYRWVGHSTYGLAQWDVGHSGEPRLQTRRTSISAEIVHLLQQSPNPLPAAVIKEHVAKRFQVVDQTINVALNRHNGRDFIIDENRMVHLSPPEFSTAEPGSPEE